MTAIETEIELHNPGTKRLLEELKEGLELTQKEMSAYQKEMLAYHNGFHDGSDWQKRQFEWNERMHEVAIKRPLTNKEFREMLEKMPDDALICVECCDPWAMVYDKEYNLIRID